MSVMKPCQIVKSKLLLLYFFAYLVKFKFPLCQLQASSNCKVHIAQVNFSCLPKLVGRLLTKPRACHPKHTQFSRKTQKSNFKPYCHFRVFFFSNFVMWLKWQSYKDDLARFGYRLDMKIEKKSESFYILTGTYHKNLAIWKPLFSKIWKIWAIFFPTENPLYRSKSYFSGQNLAKLRLLKKKLLPLLCEISILYFLF